jgi:hypothetical protein
MQYFSQKLLQMKKLPKKYFKIRTIAIYKGDAEQSSDQEHNSVPMTRKNPNNVDNSNCTSLPGKHKFFT